MSITIQNIEIPSYAGVTIRNQLFQQEGNKRLIVLLPGRGYAVTAPLLHYCLHIGMDNGFDVLRVEYGFQIAQTDLPSENIPDIQQESVLAVRKALKTGRYDELVVVGKSLGTPIAAMIANEHSPNIPTKCVLLTPIQRCHELVTVPTLAVIGTDDAAYAPDLAVGTQLVQWKVYDGLNHSLEKTGDLAASLAILPDIVQSCADFIIK
jgi:hypothetical protein